MAKDPALQKLIDDAKVARAKKEASDQATDTIRGEAKNMLALIQDEQAKALKPVFEELGKGLVAKIGEAISAAIKGLKVDVPKSDAPTVHVNVPDVHVPPFNIPTPKVTVNVPKSERPSVHFTPPEINFPAEMSLKPNAKPFPVILHDVAGKPMQFPQHMSGGVAGGRGDFFTILSIQNSTAAALVDSSGVAYSGSNPLPTSATLTLPSGQGDAATATRVVIAGNSDASVVVNSGTITTVTTLTGITNTVGVVALDRDGNPLTTGPIAQGDAATALRVIVAGNSDASVVVNSGTLTTVTTLTGITNTVNVRLDSPDGPYTAANPLPTTATISLPSGPGDGATATRFIQAGDTVSSVIVNSGTITTVTTLTGITNTVASVIVDSSGVAYSGSNPVPTSGSATLSAAVGQGDTASALRVVHAGDSAASVASQAQGLNETTSGVLRVVQMSDTASSVVVNSGTITTVTTLTGITNTIATALVDSTGVAYSGSNPVPTSGSATLSAAKDQGDTASALRVVHAGDSAASVMSQATGLNETTAGVIRMVQMSDTVNSVYANNPFGQGDVATALRVVQAGNVASSVMTAATGLNETTVDVLRVVQMSDTAASVQAKVIAMTTLPTAAADAATAFQKSDKIGRAINRPVNARDLIATAYVTLSTGTEATLLAGVAGNFLDMISIIAANTSTAAVQLDIRAVTAGNIVQTLYIPANATAGWTPPVPWPQDATGNNWTVDMGDFTNSNILISALFSKEI